MSNKLKEDIKWLLRVSLLVGPFVLIILLGTILSSMPIHLETDRLGIKTVVHDKELEAKLSPIMPIATYLVLLYYALFPAIIGIRTKSKMFLIPGAVVWGISFLFLWRLSYDLNAGALKDVMYFLVFIKFWVLIYFLYKIKEIEYNDPFEAENELEQRYGKRG